MDELNWDKLKESKEDLIEFVKDNGGLRPSARKLNVNHTSIKYWLDKYNVELEDILDPTQGNTEEIKGKEDDDYEPDIEEHDDYYVIRRKEERPIFFTKDQEREFRALYCAHEPSDRLTLNACARELGFSLKEMKVIKRSLGIVHDSIEFIDDEVENLSEEELSERALMRKKRRVERKIKEKQYRKAIRENKKYSEKDYFYNKVSKTLLNGLNTLEYREPKSFNVEKELNDYVLVINISDWHKGKVVLSSELITDAEYNVKIFQKRINKFLKRAIQLIKIYNPKKIYILNYGDGPDDPNHDTYEGQFKYQELSGEEQLISYIDSLIYFILTIHDYNPNIFYSGVPGNHSSGEVNWDALSNMLLDKLLKNYDSIEIDADKKMYKIHSLYGNYIIQTHGNEIRTGTYTGEVDTLNIARMAGLPLRQTYVVHGHLHHERVEGTKLKRVYLPSLVGSDDLSENILNVSSRPAQLMFTMNEEGIMGEHHVYFDDLIESNKSA